MKTIMMIEDDKNLSESIFQYLTKEGFHVAHCENLEDARFKLNLMPELIILDWMLPDGQGIDFLRELRKKEIFTPIILLTSRTELVDKVLGLETGANDYITKPFEPRELVARIRSHLRTKDSLAQSKNLSDRIEISGITLVDHSREVRFKNR